MGEIFRKKLDSSGEGSKPQKMQLFNVFEIYFLKCGDGEEMKQGMKEGNKKKGSKRDGERKGGKGKEGRKKQD